MATSPIITINIAKTGAKDSATVSTLNNAAFASISLLKEDDNHVGDYMTLEWNYSLLDGSMGHMPDDMAAAGYPVFSDRISDIEGNTGFQLNVLFSEPISSYGPSIGFLGDYPAEMGIAWYDAAGKEVFDTEKAATSLEYVHDVRVDNYTKIIISILRTNTPYRFVKIENILFGKKVTFDKEKLLKATITEELDMVSNQLSINTLEFTFFDKNNDFNALSSNSTFALLETQQRITVRENVGNNVIEMGTLYLDGFESMEERQVSFKAICAIGLLDKTTFKKGRIYSNEKAGSIIDEIMASAGFDDYEIEGYLREIVVSGYLPICSHRQALQQIVFAMRAVADCSRGRKIRIYRVNTAYDSKINYNRQFASGSTLKEREFVSTVEITTHRYSLTNEEKKLFEGNIKAGITEILFTKPTSGIRAEGAELIEAGCNYAIVRSSRDGNCILYGKEYEDKTAAYVRSVKNAASGRAESVVKVSDAYFVGGNNAYLLAEHLQNYYSMRAQAQARVLLEGEVTGRWVALRSQYELFVVGMVERQVIDLNGGYISEMTVTGYNTQDIEQYFTGKEIWTGEMIGVI